MRIVNGCAALWLLYLLGLQDADTQTTEKERFLIAKHAAGRCSLVETGVLHGVNTALLRSASWTRTDR